MSLAARIQKLQAAAAISVRRIERTLGPVARSARAAAMLGRADPSGPMTADNRRCMRVAELLARAAERKKLGDLE